MTSETIAYILAATINLSGLPAKPAPDIVRMPQETLAVVACPDQPCPSIIGYYDREMETIYVLDTLDFDNNETDAAVLVHEMTHHLQSSDSCANEREAYRVQNAYLKKHGQLYRAGAAMWFFTCEEQ